MAAVSSTSPVKPLAPSAPLISDAVRAQLAQERRRLAADPSVRHVPAELSFGARHVYRTRPGTYRRVRHNLPMCPDEATYGDEKAYRFALRRWKVLVAQSWFPDLPREEAADKLAAYLETVRDALGDTKLKFTTVPRHQECYFVTNDDVVAGYLDQLIERGIGEFAQVYKEHKARLVVGAGTDKAEAFPNTELGSRLARAYAAEHGFDEIKLVKE